MLGSSGCLVDQPINDVEVISDISVRDSKTLKPIVYDIVMFLGVRKHRIGVFKMGYKPCIVEITSPNVERDILLCEGESLVGRVIDQSGNPIVGASIIFPQGYTYISNEILGETNGEGLFIIPDIRGLTDKIDILKRNYSAKEHSLKTEILNGDVGTISLGIT